MLCSTAITSSSRRCSFIPIGVSLAAHSLSFYNSLLWIPLAALFGDIAAYNLTVLLTFILSGYTMFLVGGVFS